jgi:hypothetical protein
MFEIPSRTGAYLEAMADGAEAKMGSLALFSIPTPVSGCRLKEIHLTIRKFWCYEFPYHTIETSFSLVAAF